MSSAINFSMEKQTFQGEARKKFQFKVWLRFEVDYTKFQKRLPGNEEREKALGDSEWRKKSIECLSKKLGNFSPPFSTFPCPGSVKPLCNSPNWVDAICIFNRIIAVAIKTLLLMLLGKLQTYHVVYDEFENLQMKSTNSGMRWLSEIRCGFVHL